MKPRLSSMLPIVLPLLLAASSRRVDLEVGVPPGSPTGWGRWIPALTPAREPLFPTTGSREPKDAGKTFVPRPRAPVDPRIAGAGVLRITTADIPAHLPWVSGPTRPTGPITGPGGRALPPVGVSLQWLGNAALLRWLLHRQQVSEAEIVAHLVELGEPALWACTAAAGENGLRELAQKVRIRIERMRGGTALPTAKDAREAMWLRFVADELAAAHPYDPEDAFGYRLFVFAAPVEPLLIRFLQTDADPFLVRNAAAALGRYRTPTAQAALAAAALDTRDDVVLMRALAALDVGCPIDGLLARLDACTDAVERAALVAALGRSGATAAVPKVVAAGRRGLRDDSDLLLTVLVALHRLPLALDDRDTAGFLAAVERAAGANPTRFRVEHDGRESPDFPDADDLRGDTLRQLATLVQLRHGTSPSAARDLTEMLADTAPARAGSSFTNRPFSVFWPLAQMPLMETLPRLEEPGLRRLAEIAADETTDPVLRVAALAALPTATRDGLAARILEGRPAAPIELQLGAVQVLDADGAPALIDVGRRRLQQLGRMPAGVLRSGDRSLWQTLIAALDRRGALTAEDLLPLLAHVRAAPPLRAGASPGARRAWLREQALALVQSAADGLSGTKMERRIDELVGRVIEARLDDRFTEATRAGTVRYVKGLLEGLRGRGRDAAVRQMIADGITDYFVPDPAGAVLSQSHEFHAVVPLEESILLALGRTRAPEASAALVALLGEKALMRRAHVCLAMGRTGDRKLAQPLARALLDDDGFVRLCAYMSLCELTGKDVFADWLYGPVAERGAAAQEWFRIAAKAGG